MCFTLSRDLVAELTKCAEDANMNRSAFLEWVLSKVLPLVPPLGVVFEDMIKTSFESKKNRGLKCATATNKLAK